LIQAVFNHRRRLASLAMLAMLLRVVIPSGYMPSSLADGWYLQFCPDGIPSAVMALLIGDDSHHHHHHGDMADAMKSGSESDSASMFNQCDIGGGFASAFIPQAVELPVGTVIRSYVIYFRFSTPTSSPSHHYLARAPPEARLS
jgi:hypothetical protein